ncbi:MAG: uracil-DNA glycosylase [Proteocatella sp.]
MEKKSKLILEFGMEEIRPSWKKIIFRELEEKYFVDLLEFLSQSYNDTTIYPPKEKIFEIFKRMDFEEVKVVIIGQDPYHGEGQANGMCFSVNDGIKNPPSLKNIFKEIFEEYGILRTSGDLTDWVDQGILLLNSILTVEQSKAGSHRKKGWEEFTNKIIYELKQRNEPVVFILWGNDAIKKAGILEASRHCVLTSTHPSPLSCYRGFFGNDHFRLTNEYLKTIGKKEIIWI